MASRESASPPTEYRKGAGVDYSWGALFALKRPEALGDILNKLGSVVASFADPQLGLSGAVLGTGKASNRSTFVLGLDPSRTYGTPTVRQNNMLADAIGQQCGWRRRPLWLPEMRIILGRRTGYEGRVHSMARVQRLAADNGAARLRFTAADLFSVRYVDGLRTYHEPAVIVAGQTRYRENALALAAVMKQERLVVEEKGKTTQVYER